MLWAANWKSSRGSPRARSRSNSSIRRTVPKRSSLDSILSTSTQLAEKLYTSTFTTSLVAATPRWEQARNNFPTSYLCATGYASVPMLGRALAEPVAPGKPEKRNREVISDLFSTRQRRSQRGSERAVYNFSASCVEVERIESKKLWAGGRRAECARYKTVDWRTEHGLCLLLCLHFVRT